MSPIYLKKKYSNKKRKREEVVINIVSMYRVEINEFHHIITSLYSIYNLLFGKNPQGIEDINKEQYILGII